MSDATRATERFAVRLTKGALVAVLVGGMTAMAAAAHESPSSTASGAGATVAASATSLAAGVSSSAAQELVDARAAVVDAAADAVTVAQVAQKAGKATDVDTKKLTALKSAAAKLEDLVEEARTTPVDADDVARASRSASRSGTRTENSSASPAPSAKAAAPAKGASAKATAPAKAGASAKSSAAAEPNASAEPSPSAKASASSGSDAPATDAAPQGQQSEATAGGAPVVTGPLTSAAETGDMIGAIDGAAADPDAPDTVDEIVVPAVTGPEDETTAELRAALDKIVALAGSVEDTAAKRQEAAEAAAKKRAAWKKSLEGYANGRIPASALCHPSFDSSALLRCDAAEALEDLNAAFRAEFGTNISMTDSYRSYAGQVSCRMRKGRMCAVPGTSNHGTGVAVDFGSGIDSFTSRQHRWMSAHAAEFGWVHPAWAEPGASKPEPWHWEYTG